MEDAKKGSTGNRFRLVAEDRGAGGVRNQTGP
jgi:hypothetical protein